MSDVLVIHLDDNPDDRALLVSALAEAGIAARVVPAENAVQTYAYMRLMKHAPPDLVVIDLNLPVIKGQTVLRDLKCDPEWKSVPAVVLSSSDLDKDIEECLGLGAEAYFVKPARYEGYLDIAGKLREHLRKRRRATTSSESSPPDRVSEPPTGRYRWAI